MDRGAVAARPGKSLYAGGEHLQGRRVLIGLILVILLLLTSPVRAAETDADIEGWLDSVVMLVTGPAWCSGVVIDEAGTVATAYHCVTMGRKSTVRLRSGEEYTGRTIAAQNVGSSR